VIIHSGRDKRERPFHDWQRIYQFPNKTRHSNARLVYDENHQSPVELFRPKGMVQVCWDAQFKSPSTILIETTNYVLKVGSLQLSLPQWIRGQVTAVETIDPHNPARIHLSFKLSYPRLGSVFGYEGTFDCVKRPYRQSHDEIKIPL
jgi:hypothetical protein